MAKDRPDDSMGAQNDQTPLKLADTAPEEKREAALRLAEKLDPENMQSIVLFGSQAQANLLEFSHTMIEHVQRKDAGEMGQILADLMLKLDQVNPDDLQMKNKGFFARLFKRVSGSVQEVLSKYQKTSVQIDRISRRLEHSKNVLLSDNKLLDELYAQNKQYFSNLTMYIAAGIKIR